MQRVTSHHNDHLRKLKSHDMKPTEPPPQQQKEQQQQK